MERFSISMEDDLVEKFDGHLERRGYSNRSEAVRDLVRNGAHTDISISPRKSFGSAWICSHDCPGFSISY